MDGGYTWLGVMIVIGSMISLGYYLRVIAAMWMPSRAAEAKPPDARPAMAGGSPEADAQRDLPATVVAVVFGAASLVFGIIPSPLFHVAEDAGRALGLL